jgi:hypothetical protein
VLIWFGILRLSEGLVPFRRIPMKGTLLVCVVGIIVGVLLLSIHPIFAIMVTAATCCSGMMALRKEREWGRKEEY